MAIYITSGLLWGVGIACFFLMRDKKKYLKAIDVFPLRKTGEIIASGDTGAFHTAKVRGKVVCDKPIKSELSESDCVYYEMEVVRHYKKRVREQDSSGKTSTRYAKRTSRVSHNERHTDFYLEDDSGRIKVSLEGAKFDKEKILSDYRPDAGGGMELSFGSFHLDLGGMFGNEMTLGYEYKEWIIPVDKEVLAVAGIKKIGDDLCLSKPDDARYKYIISFKDEDSLKKEIKKDAMWSTVATVLCLSLGMSSLLYGLIVGGIIKL